MAPRRKLTGAQAKLFAAVCHHYINEAESDCNDTPDEVPVFSHLSRAQRLKLVADVAIGMNKLYRAQSREKLKEAEEGKRSWGVPCR